MKIIYRNLLNILQLEIYIIFTKKSDVNDDHFGAARFQNETDIYLVSGSFVHTAIFKWIQFL